MNIWKVTAIASVLGMTLLGGKLVNDAHAAPASDKPAVAYEWGQEQPHMQKALDDLAAARHSLEIAAENKGGWRVLALKHVDEAVAEVNRGTEYGRRHPHDE